ncbi:RAB42 protein, partial [Urocolius indicus]|nr:RAB42 protein [Urocolius indicus]
EAAGDRDPPTFLLVGHKCDLVAQRAVSAEEAEALAASLGMAFVETSARTNLNVELAFQMLAGSIQQALARGALSPPHGCGGIRLIPSHSHGRAPVQGQPRAHPHHCQC